jgi:hypothetical protein
MSVIYPQARREFDIRDGHTPQDRKNENGEAKRDERPPVLQVLCSGHRDRGHGPELPNHQRTNIPSTQQSKASLHFPSFASNPSQLFPMEIVPVLQSRYPRLHSYTIAFPRARVVALYTLLIDVLPDGLVDDVHRPISSQSQPGPSRPNRPSVDSNVSRS